MRLIADGLRHGRRLRDPTAQELTTAGRDQPAVGRPEPTVPAHEPAHGDGGIAVAEQPLGLWLRIMERDVEVEAGGVETLRLLDMLARCRRPTLDVDEDQ